jgi:two-component system, sensor histidine kinase LadS
MPKLLFSFLFSLVLFFTVKGQVELKVGEKPVPVAGAGIQYLFTDSMSYSHSAVQMLMKNDWQIFSDEVKVSYQPQVLWLKIPLSRIAAIEEFELLSVDNPHLNEIGCWVIRSGNINISFPPTGDHLFFSSRPIPATSFVFPLEAANRSTDTLLLAIEKRSSRLDVPLWFYKEKSFLFSQQQSYLLKGLLCGLILLLIIFNLLLFASSFEAVYAWYGIYLVSILVFFTADAGLLFQFLYPDHPHLNDLTRPFAFAFSLVPLLLFFNALLNIRRNFPGIYKLNWIVLVIYLLVFFSALATSITGNHLLQERWLHVNSVLVPGILLIFLTEAVFLVMRQVRFAWFALLSFSIFTIAITFYSLGQNGLIRENFLIQHAHYGGILMDCLIVSLSLVWRYYSFRSDARRLQLESMNHQKQIFEETTAWQKQEMQSFSSLLHDNVGAHLGFLRLKVDKMELSESGRREVAGLVTELGNEVRHMSHHFSPLPLQDKGLFRAVEEMVQRVRSDSSIALQFEWLGNRKPLGVQYELLGYRVLQELLQNLLKHSRASEAILQIIQEEQIFVIYLEDNGIGSGDLADANKGIGLKSIKQLILLLKGRISVTTEENKGFSISIEFPLIK